MIIDTHCHVYESEMENAQEIIRQALKQDIHLILNGTDPLSNTQILELSARYTNVHAALGYLYSFADEVSEDDISLLESRLDDDRVVAVGEIGLDYYHGKDSSEKQKILFERMLELACKHDLPVIVHCRKAMQDTYDILKEYDVKGSLHCYQGSAEMAERFVKLGFHIGIGGPVTHPNNRKVKKTLERIDINRILVETDSPYLAPEEKRGQINTPMNLKYIIRKIAEELDMSENEVAETTGRNAEELFKIC